MASVILDNVSLHIISESLSERSWRKNLIRGIVGNRVIKNGKNITIEALNNINLNIKNRCYIGIEGHNGSGKSTLLRLIAGIYHPTKGTVQVSGKVSTLFSLGQGLNPELSGIENIIRLGIYNGLSLIDSKSIIDDVLSFSELGEYANLPVKVYSNGMQARLSFAVSTAVKPNILLIDEIIGVGDERFQKKASKRIKTLIDKADILFLASHSRNIINQYCDRIIVLEGGTITYSNINN